jgi:hypothetical protein
MVAGGEVTTMGLLWYVAAIFAWWLVGGLGGGLGQYSTFKDFEFAVAVAMLWNVPWWLPYTTWVALGELILFRRYPDRRAPLVAFAVLSLVVYSAINASLFRNDAPLLPMLIWPAVAVTVIYLVRRSVRTTSPKTRLGKFAAHVRD